jgi:hypothetical protein
MLKYWFKLASTVIGIKRGKNPRGEPFMVSTCNEYYEKEREQRRLEVQKIRDQIQVDIESVCREKSSLTTSEYGFGSLSLNSYEDSIQKSVYDLLTEDGYRCMLSFTWVNGSPKSSLTIWWGKYDEELGGGR